MRSFSTGESHREWNILFKIVLALSVVLISCDYKSEVSDQMASAMQDSVDTYLNYSNNSELSRETRIASISKALSFTRDIKNDSLKQSSFSRVRRAYRDLKDFDRYKQVNNEIIEFCLRINDSLGVAKAHSSMGYHYSQVETKMDSAYDSYYTAERIYAKLGDQQEVGKALLSMAIIQKNVNDFVGGEASSIKAIQFLESFNDYRNLGSAYSNLGLILNELQRYDEAIEYHKRSLEYRKELKNNVYEVSSLNNIGLVYLKKKQFSEAIKYYEQGLAYDSLFQKRPETYARLMDNRAYAKFLSGEMKELPKLFNDALELRVSLQDDSDIVTSKLHLAEYYLANDSLAKANAFAREALETSKPINYNRGILESLQLLLNTANGEEALDYSKQYIAINDSLRDTERAFQDKFARIRFETDTLELEKEKVTKQREQLIVIMLVLVALFLFIYTLIQRRANRKELRFRQSQQKSNEEIYSLMLAQQSKLEEGKQMEKHRISEELHDGVLGRLFGTRLSLDSLNSKSGIEAVESRSNYIGELKSIEQEIRRISHDLKSNIFTSDDAFVDVVESLIENQSVDSELNFKFENDDKINWELLADSTKVHLYRIVQESIQNIRKHAKAKNVKVSFEKSDDEIILCIDDNGRGMPLNRVKEGIGIKNIKSRVKQMKGKLEIDSSKGKGTTILVKINY